MSEGVFNLSLYKQESFFFCHYNYILNVVHDFLINVKKSGDLRPLAKKTFIRFKF